MPDLVVIAHLLPDDGSIPNNPDLQLLVYPNAFDVSADGRVDPTLIREIFRQNEWGNSWVNGVFSYHHYHAEAHEVLGCFSGSARVLFGGENGVEVEIKSRAAVVIPAGVGHKNLGCSSDFGVVGAYPPGQSPDMKYGEPDERPACLEAIARTAPPTLDPVAGSGGPLIAQWRIEG